MGLQPIAQVSRPITLMEALRRDFTRPFSKMTVDEFEAGVEQLMRDGTENDTWTPEPGGLPAPEMEVRYW